MSKSRFESRLPSFGFKINCSTEAGDQCPQTLQQHLCHTSNNKLGRRIKTQYQQHQPAIVQIPDQDSEVPQRSTRIAKSSSNLLHFVNNNLSYRNRETNKKSPDGEVERGMSNFYAFHQARQNLKNVESAKSAYSIQIPKGNHRRLYSQLLQRENEETNRNRDGGFDKEKLRLLRQLDQCRKDIEIKDAQISMLKDVIKEGFSSNKALAESATSNFPKKQADRSMETLNALIQTERIIMEKDRSIEELTYKVQQLTTHLKEKNDQIASYRFQITNLQGKLEAAKLNGFVKNKANASQTRSRAATQTKRVDPVQYNDMPGIDSDRSFGQRKRMAQDFSQMCANKLEESAHFLKNTEGKDSIFLKNKYKY